jgi:hypothetical protein
VINAFKDATKLPIQADTRALEEAGIVLDTPITFSVKNLSAQSALNLMLANLDLTWTIHNGTVLITTQERAESPDYLITKVYAVQDLVVPRPSYRFEGAYVPGLSQGGFPRTLATGKQPQVHLDAFGGAGSGSLGNPNGAGGMGGMKSMGGGMGGGMFNVPDAASAASSTPVATPPATQPAAPPAAQPTPPKPPREHGGGICGGMQEQLSQPSPENDSAISMDELIDTITTCIRPTTWDTVGGAGSITSLAGMLMVRQTLQVHFEVEKLIEEIRTTSPDKKNVTLRATWLLLTLEQRNQLLESNASKNGVDRKALEAMAAQTPGYIGEISCFCGQTVHLASNRIRSAVVGAIPVVGGGGEDPGYQPIIAYPQSGVVLQATPQLLPDRKNAVLDLFSVVTFSGTPDETFRFLGSDATGRALQGKDAASAGRDPIQLTLDRVKMLSGQLGTTIKMPLGEPVLVGGLSQPIAPGEAPQTAAMQQQMYLFIEAVAK